MAMGLRVVYTLLVGMCCLLAFVQLQSTWELQGGLAAARRASAGGSGNLVDSETAEELIEVISDMQKLATRMSELEQSIQSYTLELSQNAAGESARTSASAADEAAAPDEAAPLDAAEGSGAQSSPTGHPKTQGRYRPDGSCGQPLGLGSVVQCDPESTKPCCNSRGRCGGSREDCACKGCIDYRHKHVANDYEDHRHHKGDTVGNRTVVVIIPFRDREGHLVAFKQYWQWFAMRGNHPRKVKRWEVFVVEQFDSMTFNRGWNFNVGFAIATADKSASPDVHSDMRIKFDCAVIQDIDYLPEKGVDYAECDVPMQLSSEIDRYHWKTPYLKSCGGIVGMSEKHWKKINGFGNNYFGWGGEDDELYHRLRLNNLLKGDCYPHCNGKNDENIGKQIAIKRPRPGHGRFSGKYMHSANHTKRITDAEAYARNVEMLEDIEGGSDRWKKDGLKDLQFRILWSETDTSQSALGVTYHLYKVHRGSSPFDLKGLHLAVPFGLCDESSEDTGLQWAISTLGEQVPWDIAALRGLASRVLGDAGGSCTGFVSKSMSFILVDRRRGLAKILTDGDPRFLIVFYRSLKSPADDGLIIADGRARDGIKKAMVAAKAFVSPTAQMTICQAKMKKGGDKYSIHLASVCTGQGWTKVPNGDFRAYAKPRQGLMALTYCDNEKYWTQRIVKGESCPKSWANLKWKHSGTVWVERNKGFCVSSRKTKSTEDLSFSRVMPQETCAENTDQGKFVEEFTFSTAENQVASLAALIVCIGHEKQDKADENEENPSEEQLLRIWTAPHECDKANFTEIARFPARRAPAALDSDRVFCVRPPKKGKGHHELQESRHCQGAAFAIPTGAPPQLSALAASAVERLRICAKGSTVTVGAQCTGGVSFDAPSVADMAASVANTPLFTLLEEDSPCFSFYCEDVVASLAQK